MSAAGVNTRCWERGHPARNERRRREHQMRICRFTTSKTPTPRFGLVENDFVLTFAEGESIESFPNPRTDKPISISEVKLLAPVAPSKIVCVGRNYKEHA